jgi:hypothetical protein
VSKAEWWLRLPVIVQPALLALAVYWALPKLVDGVGEQRRLWAATLVLLAPVNVWNVFITTDTPLIYFSVLSGLAWIRAARDDSAALVRWPPACCWPARCSPSTSPRSSASPTWSMCCAGAGPARWTGLAIAYACTLPALALMAWWNSANCWPNYMFNFVNRHGDAGWSLKTPLLYAVTLIYVLGPPVLWLAWKIAVAPAPTLLRACLARPLGTLAWLPFLLFAAASGVKQIGLHWLLSFVPFTLIWLTLRLPPATLQKLGLFFAGFATLHIAAILVVSRVPLETWQKTRLYDGIVLSFRASGHGARTRNLRKDWVLAMDGYSNAVTLGYNLRQYVIVFGEASSHARHDDLVTDFRALAGRNFLILRKSEPNPDDYRRYFRRSPSTVSRSAVRASGASRARASTTRPIAMACSPACGASTMRFRPGCRKGPATCAIAISRGRHAADDAACCARTSG